MEITAAVIILTMLIISSLIGGRNLGLGDSFLESRIWRIEIHLLGQQSGSQSDVSGCMSWHIIATKVAHSIKKLLNLVGLWPNSVTTDGKLIIYGLFWEASGLHLRSIYTSRLLLTQVFAFSSTFITKGECTVCNFIRRGWGAASYWLGSEIG